VRLTKKKEVDTVVKHIASGKDLPAAKLISNESNLDNYSLFSSVAASSRNNLHRLFLKNIRNLMTHCMQGR